MSKTDYSASADSDSNIPFDEVVANYMERPANFRDHASYLIQRAAEEGVVDKDEAEAVLYPDDGLAQPQPLFDYADRVINRYHGNEG